MGQTPDSQLDLEFRASAVHPSRSNDMTERMIANALPVIVWTTDGSGRIDWLNDRWYEITGMTEVESLAPNGWMARVHPDDREEWIPRWERALASGAPTEYEYRLRDREGEYRWHVVRSAPVRDANGTVVGWSGVAFDIHAQRVVEAAARESERRFETIFRLIPQPTCILRLSDGSVMLVNDAMARLGGRMTDGALGSAEGDPGIWTDEERASFRTELTANPMGSIESNHRSPDGRLVRLEISGAEIDFRGEKCVVAVGVDVTERHETEAVLRRIAEEARARADELQALMDAVPAAVWMALDPGCERIVANRMGRELLRMKQGENISKSGDDPELTKHFGVFVEGVEVPAYSLPVQRAARGEEVRDWDEEIRFVDGDIVHLFGSAVPLRNSDGAPRGAVGAFVDVTRLKQAEAALVEADRRKDEFLALLSHELRNPLMPILTAAQLLEPRVEGEAVREVEVIHRQARHLARLVDDLIDVSRVARGKVTVTRRPIELAVVISKALEANRPFFDSWNHSVTVDVPAEGLLVAADEVRLTQVFSNLLSNAGRYTPAGGRISVMARRENEEIVVRVRDSGVGIDPSLLPHVFDLFIQGVRGPDRSEGGLGLGLSIARMLLELHGGALSAFSEGVGEGSEFVARLPVAKPSGASRATGTPGDSAPVRVRDFARRVLIVDDNHDVAEMLALLIGRYGYEAHTANDPLHALEVAEVARPQVAILDIGLPIMDGYALGRELRARLGGDSPALVALTGYSQAKDRKRSEEARFAFHLVKPVEGAQLVRLLDRLFTDRERIQAHVPVGPTP